MTASHGAQLIAASRALAGSAAEIHFRAPVRHLYNPLAYARAPAEAYLRAYAATPKRIVFVGMNPGPWGMAQTGVPFGEVSVVRDWLGISGAVTPPAGGHPRLRIDGFQCTRSEVSGRRLWGLLRDHYRTAQRLSREAFVGNYCPLMFLDAEGRNITPDKIAREDRAALYGICDRFLLELVQALAPQWLVGVGKFVEERLAALAPSLGPEAPRITAIPHPSPASPMANQDWAGQADRALHDAGVW
jgi:single-strand selective monofunctional uracil DNA glycosylase